MLKRLRDLSRAGSVQADAGDLSSQAEPRPLRSAIRYVLVLLSLCFGELVHGQLDLDGEFTGANVLVQGHRGTDEATRELIFHAVWRNVPGAGATFQLQRMSATIGDERVMLDKLMGSALGAYLDERIHFSKHGVFSDLPAGQLAMEMNAMIFSALEALDLQSDVQGLSATTRKQLERLVKIDWSQAQFGVDGGEGQDKYLAIYYYVRSQRDELERQIRADLLPLASISLLGEQRIDLGRTVQVGSSCGTVFDDDNYLCALDMPLADMGAGGIDPVLGADLGISLEDGPSPLREEIAADNSRIRKRDRWLKTELDRINERIDKLDQRKELWELRDRMDDIEDRLTGLELEFREETEKPESDNPLANLSDLTGHNITIRFTRNATQIDPGHLLLLNEVFEQLARSPMHRVLITGYTDRSGDPSVNLRLSEQRAKAVRNYLLQRGIAAERLLVNYYGDSRSTSYDPRQRRVEVEWLQEGR